MAYKKRCISNPLGNLVQLLSFALLIQVSILQSSPGSFGITNSTVIINTIASNQTAGQPIPFFTGVGGRNGTYVPNIPQLKPWGPSSANLTNNLGSILTNYLPVKINSTGSVLLPLLTKMAIDVLRYSPTIPRLFLPNFSYANVTAAQLPISVMPDLQTNLIGLLTYIKNTTEPNIYTMTKLLSFVPPFIIASFASLQQNFDIVLNDISTANTLMDLEETQGINNVNFLLTNGQDIITGFNNSVPTVQMLSVNFPLMLNLNATYNSSATAIAAGLVAILTKAQVTQAATLAVSKNGTQPFIQAILNTTSGFAPLFNQTRAYVQNFTDTVQSRNATLSALWNSNYNATCGQQMQILNQTGWYLGNATANIPPGLVANYVSLTNAYYGQISLLRSRVVDIVAKLSNWYNILNNGVNMWTNPITNAYSSVFGPGSATTTVVPISTVINNSLNELVVFLQKENAYTMATQASQGTKSVALVGTQAFSNFKNKLPTIQSVLSAISLIIDGPAAGFRQTIPVSLDFFQQVLSSPPVVYTPPSFKLPPPITFNSFPPFNFGDAVYPYLWSDLIQISALNFNLAQGSNTASAISPATQGYPLCLFSVPVYQVSYLNQNFIQAAFPMQYSDYEFTVQLAPIYPRGELNPLVTFQFPVPPPNVVVPANPIPPTSIGNAAPPANEPLNGWNNNLYSVRVKYFDSSVVVSITASDTSGFLNLLRSGNGPVITLTVTPTIVAPAF